MRAGNNFCGVRTPKADGSSQQAAHKEVMSMINTSFLREQSEPGAIRLRRTACGRALRTPSRGKEQCGAALRGHACDDISRISFPLPQIYWQKVEFIKIPRDVVQSRF